MSYLYQFSINEDSTLPNCFNHIKRDKILSMKRKVVNNKELYDCLYFRNNHKQHKTVLVDEGIPSGKSFAFYLTKKDDQKAIDILKNAISKQNTVRKDRIRKDVRKYLWTTLFIEKLSIDLIN